MIEPGTFPPVPTTPDELLIGALRHANQVGGLLVDLTAACHAAFDSGDLSAGMDRIHEMLLRRHSDCSGVHLFIAADNLRVELPPDLRAERDGDGDD